VADEKDKAMNKKTATRPIPTLTASPFAQAEIVDHDDLSAGDRDFLGGQEKIIEAGRKTFLEVGTALMEIRDYEGGRLYKRYGTFENYCLERWEFGRSYAKRLMDAVGIYKKMLPRGNITEETLMPTTEKQLRALGRLPNPKLQKTAWRTTVEAVGKNPIRTRDVEKTVQALIKSEGLAPPAARKARKAEAQFYRISAADAANMRRSLEKLRAAVSKIKEQPAIEPLIDEIEALLPDGGER
jgi:hypothetical protein